MTISWFFIRSLILLSHFVIYVNQIFEYLIKQAYSQHADKKRFDSAKHKSLSNTFAQIIVYFLGLIFTTLSNTKYIKSHRIAHKQIQVAFVTLITKYPMSSSAVSWPDGLANDVYSATGQRRRSIQMNIVIYTVGSKCERSKWARALQPHGPSQACRPG